MEETLTQTASEFHRNDSVRLLGPHGDLRAGSVGRILGRFARETEPTYVVCFEGDEVRVAGDVRPDEIAPADDLRASAA